MKSKILLLSLFSASFFLVSSTVITESPINNPVTITTSIQSEEALETIAKTLHFNKILEVDIFEKGGKEFLFVKGYRNGKLASFTSSFIRTNSLVGCRCNKPIGSLLRGIQLVFSGGMGFCLIDCDQQ